MPIPFFTSPDPDLLRGESTRDPLGLLPVWSRIGHQLIPGLATIVSRIDGILGVLFLYTCLDSISSEKPDKKTEQRILLLLERLWEYHLYRYNDKQPCFGINRLNGLDFQLNFDGQGTVGTGLRQYYRGTCNNKGILANSLNTLHQPYRTLCSSFIDRNFTVWLSKQIKNVDSNNYSLSASKAYEETKTSLVNFSKGSDELWLKLEEALISDAQQIHWIEHVVSIDKEWDSNERIPRDLVLSIQKYANSHSAHTKWADICQDILDCEPFLQVIEFAFAILQENGRSSLEATEALFRNAAPTDLKEVCLRFTKIKSEGPSKRFKSLQNLAHLLANYDYRGCIRELVSTYYPMICNDRGKQPVVRLDGNILIAVSPTGNRTDWSQSSKKWNNEYFIKTQIRLYQDLQMRKMKTKYLS